MLTTESPYLQSIPGGQTVSRDQLKAEVAELKQQEQDLYDQLAALEKEKAEAAVQLEQVRKAREERKAKEMEEEGDSSLVAAVLGSVGKS